VSEKHVRHYEARAKGGVGLIIVEACSVNSLGRAFNTQLGIWDDAHINGLKMIVKECKKHDAKILLQILHVGLKTHKSISETAMGPFECALLGNTTKAMSIEEIEELKLEFVKAAERVCKAGFNGIELHGAHGYLLEQFLLPQVNTRTDKYGGSLENRLRFAGEIIEGIRSCNGAVQ
jgi:2,4-dienoyl-CoA reductase-like NADH-dependent reductase (Old Yellow Enzyme family)